MDNNERAIISNLLCNDSFVKKVIPFIKEEYFSSQSSKYIFNEVYKFVEKYKECPSPQAISIILEDKPNVNQETINECLDLIENCNSYKENNLEWLVDNTEKFCKNKAIYNGIMESISIYDGKSKLKETAIPQLMSDALSVSFETNLGHDYIEDAEKRFEYYTVKQPKLPFQLDMFNRITEGGVIRKTLNMLLAGTHVGKTSMKCNLAAMYLLQGYNVLYFTMEMSEEEIGKRIDANLLDIPMDEFNSNLNKDYFTKRVNRLKGKNLGRLKIKEYPSGYPSVVDFEAYISELKIKEGFTPDVVIIDYLTIMTSARYKAGSVNSYTLYKSVSEELRGMGQKNNCAIWTSMQVNRGGYNASDVDFNDIAESFAVAMTADFSIAMTVTEDLISMDQVLCKQIKNRYRNMYLDKRFVIGFDRIKQRFYDCDESAQEDLIDDDIPVMDKGNFETSHKERHGKPSKIKGKYNF